MRKLILLILYLISALQIYNVQAQTYIYPKIGLNASFVRLAEDDYVSKAFRSKTAYFYTFGFRLSKSISKRTDFFGEFMLPPLGYSATISSNYTGNKKWMSDFDFAGYIRCQQLNIGWQYNTKQNCNGWIGYFKAGASTFFNFRKFNFESGLNIVNVNPVTNQRDSIEVFIEEATEPYFRLGFLAGFGLKKIIKENNYLSFGLTYHQGFSTLSTTKVTYQIDGQSFINHLQNRGTALVLEATYGFSIRKKHPSLPNDF